MNLLGWREILLTLILLIVIYMVWLVWRMRRIGRQIPPPPAQHRRDEPRVSSNSLNEPSIFSERQMREQEKESDDDDDDGEDARLTYASLRRRNPFAIPTAEPVAKSAAKPEEKDDDARQDLARQAIMTGVAREVGQLRDELDALRGAFAALRDDVQALHDAFEQEVQILRATQNASPLYSDAMQMALLGHDAITISERCGISRAEAELVIALVKKKDKA